MGMSADKIVSEAPERSPRARAFVAERLIESLDAVAGEEISPARREEIIQRCREVDEDSVELRDAADVFARAYAAPA